MISPLQYNHKLFDSSISRRCPLTIGRWRMIELGYVFLDFMWDTKFPPHLMMHKLIIKNNGLITWYETTYEQIAN